MQDNNNINEQVWIEDEFGDRKTISKDVWEMMPESKYGMKLVTNDVPQSVAQAMSMDDALKIAKSKK
jgi:hypothetical protein